MKCNSAIHIEGTVAQSLQQWLPYMCQVTLRRIHIMPILFPFLMSDLLKYHVLLHVYIAVYITTF